MAFFKRFLDNFYNRTIGRNDTYVEYAPQPGVPEPAVDGVIVRRHTDKKLYVLQHTGTLDAQRWGFSPFATPEENADAWDRLVASAPSGCTIKLQPGVYKVSRPLVIKNTSLTISGSLQTYNGTSATYGVPGAGGTQLFADGQFNLVRTLTGGEVRLHNLTLTTSRWVWKGENTDGFTPLRPEQKDKWGREAEIAHNADAFQHHGLWASTITHCDRVAFIGFSGHGAKGDGNIGSDLVYDGQSAREQYAGTNTSMSSFTDCLFKENKGCGLFMTGYDANQITAIRCDFRDNRLIGWYDNSFLGCHIMYSHGNTNNEGSYVQDYPTACATIFACYDEQGSAVSRIGQHSVRIGGLMASGCIGGTQLDGRDLKSDLHVGNAVIGPAGFSFRAANTTGGIDLNPQDTPANKSAHWQYGAWGQEQGFAGFTERGGVVPAPHGYRWGEREAPHALFYHRTAIIAGVLYASVYGEEGLADITYPMNPGDRFPNIKEGKSQPAGWRCTQGGFVKPPFAPPTATAAALRSQEEYNTTLLLSAPLAGALPGLFLEVGGRRARVVAVADALPGDAGPRLVFDRPMPLGTALPVAYAVAELTPTT